MKQEIFVQEIEDIPTPELDNPEGEAVEGEAAVQSEQPSE